MNTDTNTNNNLNLTQFKTLKNFVQTLNKPSTMNSCKTSLPCVEVPFTVRDQYLEALSRHTENVKPPKDTSRVARVCFFRWDDGMKSRKPKSRDSTTTSPPSTTKHSALTTTTTSDLKCRRVVAYVWVDNSLFNESKEEVRQGYVFYGGSVYNPRSVTKQFLQRLRECHHVDDMIQLLATGCTVPPYNKRGEAKTAVSRLKTCPVVFKTTATSHEQVRKEISRHMFREGVKSQRVKKSRQQQPKLDTVVSASPLTTTLQQ